MERPRPGLSGPPCPPLGDRLSSRFQALNFQVGVLGFELQSPSEAASCSLRRYWDRDRAAASPARNL